MYLKCFVLLRYCIALSGIGFEESGYDQHIQPEFPTQSNESVYGRNTVSLLYLIRIIYQSANFSYHKYLFVCI